MMASCKLAIHSVLRELARRRGAPSRCTLIRPVATALPLSLSLPAAATEDAPTTLRLELGETVAVTSGALAGTLATEILKSKLAPSSCRICKPPGFDSGIRSALAWSNPGRASVLSDVTQIGVPVLAASAVGLAGYDAAGSRRVLEDMLVISEALSLTLLGTQAVKFATGRVRPYAYYDPSAARGPDAFVSLWSGHAAAAFAGAAAAGQVARMRGYRSWRWVLALGLVGAGACGYFRVAADRHWATDVLASAAFGSAAGLGLPVLLHSPRERASSGFQVTVLPNGVVGEF